MNLSQKDIFLESEGDKWFDRNMLRLSGDRREIQVFHQFVKPGHSVLEIGCAGGATSVFFCSLGAEYSGIEPSAKAINSARKNFPGSEFHVGTADVLPFGDAAFDFVYFGFCLYLVDRKLLARVVAEADRVLKSPGFLAILDFETKFPYRSNYIHQPGVSSYKMDYSALFLAYPHYALALKNVFSHATTDKLKFVEDIQERVSTTVLYKNIDHGYHQN